jgi:hypothetical protein
MNSLRFLYVPILKPATTRTLAASLFVIALSSQSALLCQTLHPRISYGIHVDAADLSGFNVEMRVRGAGDSVHIAMASHPEYDDRYWRYVENLTAESRGATLQVTREENALWRIVAPSGDLTVKYRIHLPPQTTQIRAAWKPFLSSTGGLIGDLHAFICRRCDVGTRARDARPPQRLGDCIRTRSY